MVFEALLTPLVFNAAVFAISLFILFYSADLLIDGISSYAKKLGLSDEIIGLVVIALAASMPEIVAALGGLAANETGLLFGTIIGANMVHMGFLVGGLALLGRKLTLECRLIQKSKFLIWALLLLPFVLASDGLLSRSDGIVLVAVFGIYLVRLWKLEEKRTRLKKHIHLKNVWRDVAIFLGALIALILSGRYLVFSAIILSREFGIPSYFIAITVIAICSAIPDFAVGIRSIFKGKQDIGIGDIIGSTVIELLLFLGIVAIFEPLTIIVPTIATASIFLIICITLLLFFLRNRAITWKHGLALMGVYLAFIITEIWKLVSM